MVSLETKSVLMIPKKIRKINSQKTNIWNQAILCECLTISEDYYNKLRFCLGPIDFNATLVIKIEYYLPFR